MAKEDLKKSKETEKPLVNCLRNTRIVIRHVPKQSRMITNPKHVLFGGMAESSTRTFVVPKLSSGRYVNVLTDDEKNFLENIMGLEPNALSIYKKENNYWSDANPMGASKVTLTKQDNYLDLSNPEEYIKYKILLANKDFIAPSLDVYQNQPKATYQYVIINENDDVKEAKKGMNLTMQCYTQYGKIEDDFYTLKTIIELVNGVNVSSTSKLDFLQTKINEIIQSNPKMFLAVATDSALPAKVLIKRSVEAGLIANRGNQFYIRDGNIPMCENGDPTLNVAANWINLPKNQNILLSLQAKLKEQ